MIFPYMEHDLAGLLANKAVVLEHGTIKTYAFQLLEGTAYLHRVSLRALQAISSRPTDTLCLRFSRHRTRFYIGI